MSNDVECLGMSAGYGRMVVCRRIDLTVPEGSFVAVLGPNGAGKSTLLRGMAGLSQKGGVVRVGGRDLSRLGPAARARAGVAFVPESRGNVFPTMTVYENLQVAGRRTPPERRAGIESVISSLFPILRDYENKQAGLLSGGEQQMLAIAMALMAEPTVVLLDEPSQGLAPSVLRSIEEALRSLRSTGITVLLAEQNQRFATSLADIVYEIRGGALAAAEPASLGI